jgi:hypothetical protein
VDSKKLVFFEDGGVLFLRLYGAVVCDVLELPPIIFLWKNYLVPLQKGQLLSLFLHPLSVAMAQIYAIAGI